MTSAERKAKFARNGSKNGMYGKTHSDDVKNRISLLNKGKEPSNKGKSLEESVGVEKAKILRKRLSELAKVRTGSKNPFYGKKHSIESINKMREKNLGKKPINMRQVQIGTCIYESVTEASRNLNVCPATIIYRIKSENFKEYNYYNT